jgi:hypothetical protein
MSGGGELVRIKTLKARSERQHATLKRRLSRIIDASKAISIIVAVKVPESRRKRRAKKRRRGA